MKFSNAEDQVANDDVGGGGGDNDDGWEDFQGGVDFGDPALGDQGGEEEEEDDARRHNDEEILKAMLPEEEESNGAASRVSYEELVMKRVSEYVQQSQVLWLGFFVVSSTACSLAASLSLSLHPPPARSTSNPRTWPSACPAGTRTSGRA